MAEQAFDLDRDQNIKNNIDALGKKWEIKQERGRALYFARPNPDRSDAVIPKHMQGLWTKVELLGTEIAQHVKVSWDKADAAKAATARKEKAAKEAKANVKKESKDAAAKAGKDKT